MPIVPPGALPVLGHALALRDPDTFFRQQRDVLGHSCVKLRLPDGERTFLLDPRDFPAVFKNSGLKFREFSAEIMAKVFGIDAFLGRGDDLDIFSHLITRYMKGDALVEMTERMQPRLEARMRQATTERYRSVGLFEFLNEHFFAAGLEAMFGDGIYSRQVFDAYDLLNRRFNLLASGVPSRLLPGVRRARQQLADAVHPRLPGRANMFDVREKAYADFGLSRAERDLSEGSLIWALQANTVATAFWTLLYVLRDPQARRALTAEVDAVIGPRPAGQLLTTDQLKRLRMLDSAMMEAMRLTSASIIARRAEEPAEIVLRSGERLALSRGDGVFLYTRLTHLDPEVFEDAFVYHHDRFVPGAQGPPTFYKGGEKLAFAYLPFGAGVSTCPGRFFARNEMKIILATLLSGYDLELAQTELPAMDLGYLGLGILPPKYDVQVRLRQRSAAQAA